MRKQKTILKIVITFLFFPLFVSSVGATSIADKIKGKGYKEVQIELRTEDENRNELILPLKVVWKDYKKRKTYISKNFLDDSLTSFSKRLPKREYYGYLYFYNTGKQKVLEKPISFKINYNYKGKLNTKRILYFVQLKREKKYYKIVKLYTEDDLKKEEEKKVVIKDVFIKGKVTSFFGEGINVGLYNEKGERLYNGYVNKENSFSIKLNNYKDRIKLNKKYYLIWGKNGDVTTGTIGFLYDFKKYSFKSYRELESIFDNDITLSTKINIKDKAVKEGFPFLYAFILFSLYLGIIFVIYNKGIKRITKNINNQESKVVNESRKNLILKIKKNVK